MSRGHLREVTLAIEHELNFAGIRVILQPPRVPGAVGRKRLRLRRLVTALERRAAAGKPRARPVFEEDPAVVCVPIKPDHERIRQAPAARLCIEPAEQNSAAALTLLD